MSVIFYISSLVGLGCVWLFWKYKDRFIGTDNRHRWFAQYYKDFPNFYNGKTRPMKKQLFESLEGLRKPGKELKILEIGAGPGANLQFYPENTKLTVVDPNPYFKEQLVHNLKKFPNVTLDSYLVTGAEDMKVIADHSFDVVVSTIVLCSCDKVEQVYKEVCRVLTPGGKFFYMEHVIDDKTFSWFKLLQVFLSELGIFPFFFDGCRCDKNLEKALQKSEFSRVDSQRFRLDLSEGLPLAMTPVYMIIPHLYGTATMASNND